MRHRLLERVDLLLERGHILTLGVQLVGGVVQCLSDVRLNSRIGAAAGGKDDREAREESSRHGSERLTSGNALVRVNPMMERGVAPPIVSNDHQSPGYSLVGFEDGSRRHDFARVVRRPRGNVRPVRHRTSAPSRGERSYGGAGSHPGRELAFFIGSASGDHPPGRCRGRDRHGRGINRGAGRVDRNREPEPSGVVRGTTCRVSRFDVIRPTRPGIWRGELDRGGPARPRRRNAVRVSTWPHASLIGARNDVILVTGLHGLWIGAELTHVTRPVRR